MPRDMQRLMDVIVRHLPESPPLFPAGRSSPTASENFRIAEIIREKLTLELHEELPYGIAVEIEAHERGRGPAGRRCGDLGGSRGPETHRDRRRAANA